MIKVAPPVANAAHPGNADLVKQLGEHLERFPNEPISSVVRPDQFESFGTPTAAQASKSQKVAGDLTELEFLATKIVYPDSPPKVTGLDRYRSFDPKSEEARRCPVDFEIEVASERGGFSYRINASEAFGVETVWCKYSAPRLATCNDSIKPEDLSIVQARVRSALSSDKDLAETLQRIPQLGELLGVPRSA